MYYEKKENIEKKDNNSSRFDARLIGIILIIISVLIFIHVHLVSSAASQFYKATTGEISHSPYCIYFNNRIDGGLVNISFLILIILNIFVQISLKKTKKAVLVLALIITMGCWFLSSGPIIECNGILDHSCGLTDTDDC